MKLYSQQPLPKICCICGRNHGVEAAHVTHKGMGGRGKKAPKDAHQTADLCAGTGGNTEWDSCHALQEAGHIVIDRGKDYCDFTPDKVSTPILRRRGIHCFAGKKRDAPYFGVAADEMGDLL
jgi:hypothetical protein